MPKNSPTGDKPPAMSADRPRWQRWVGAQVPAWMLTGLSILIAVALIGPLMWLVVDVSRLGREAARLAVAPATLTVLGRTVALVVVVTATSILVGVPLAALTTRTDLPLRRFWTIVVALPLAIPSYLGAFAAVSAFGPQGVIAELLAPLGIDWVPTVYGFAGAALVLTIYTYPYVFLTTRAALLSFDRSQFEAARTLNADRWGAFRRVVLPQLRPAIAAGALLVALYTLSDFGTPNIMRVEVFTQFIYARYNAFMREYAALLSLQLLAVTAIILYAEAQLGVDTEGAYGGQRQTDTPAIRLGWWRYPATLLPAGIGLVSIGLPVLIFGLWMVQTGPGYATGGVTFSWSYGWNSVYVSLLAAIGAILVALPIGLRGAVSDSRIAALADRLPYVGYATPGIVLAIALLSSSLDVLPPLYKTIPLLVFAYIVRFVPQAIGTIRATRLGIDQRLIEAGRVLGRSRLETFRAVTLPLLVPGIATGGALVFLTTMKELPATLLLRPLEFDTLVTYIWQVQEAGLYGRAAIPALVLVLISGLSMAVLVWSGGRPGGP